MSQNNYQSFRKTIQIERKSFVLITENNHSGFCRLTEIGSKKSVSILLGKEETKWVLESWWEFWFLKGGKYWWRKLRTNERTIIFKLSRNREGRFLELLVLGQRETKTLIFPEGNRAEGWWILYQSLKNHFKRKTGGYRVQLENERKARRRGNGSTQGQKACHNKVEGSRRLRADCPGCGRSLECVFEGSVTLRYNTQGTGDEKKEEDEDQRVSQIKLQPVGSQRLGENNKRKAVTFSNGDGSNLGRRVGSNGPSKSLDTNHRLKSFGPSPLHDPSSKLRATNSYFENKQASTLSLNPNPFKGPILNYKSALLKSNKTKHKSVYDDSPGISFSGYNGYFRILASCESPSHIPTLSVDASTAKSTAPSFKNMSSVPPQRIQVTSSEPIQSETAPIQASSSPLCHA